ncbi:MAG: MFS transporter [Pseudooceanicola sp.]|jgi:16S rRNA (guanine1207-N2)-methyltransferase|nr:MFS transporter [Pseudooceanicola sp.]
MSPRLSLALSEGGLTLPEEGMIAVLHPGAEFDLSSLPADRVCVIQPHAALNAQFAGAGFACQTYIADTDRFAACILSLPRAKAQARALIAQAVAHTDGLVVIDGAKTDGVDSILRDLRKRTTVGPALSKAHGKLLWFDPAGADVSDWAAVPGQADNFVTAPGVFSADGIDPASALLAAALPRPLGRHVVDLGAGWGYLSAMALRDPAIATLDLVEVDYHALACARANVTDPRARFYWADATQWAPEGRADTVIMNPPFHTGRAADPELGRAFIRAAARLLAPSGHLWMVANRHLAYETTLRESFTQVTEAGGDTRFKIVHAQRPQRPRPA